jgi:hypothetical protein
VALDYDGIDALGYTQAVFAGEPVDLEITRANDWDVIRYYWDHPDIGYRTAHRIAAISFGLGLIGLVLGFCPCSYNLSRDAYASHFFWFFEDFWEG